MDDLQELATNARMDHWPAHLGVKTEQEKIEYLASVLEKAADYMDDPCQQCDECEHCTEHGGA